MNTVNLEQDLQYIKGVLENNRRHLIDNGIFYILWGVMTVLGTIISYFLIDLDLIDILPWFWLGFILIFFAIQMILDRKTESTEHVRSFGWKIFTAVWRSVGVTCIIFSVLYFTTDVIPVPVFLAVICGIFGIAYYLSGIINDIKFLNRLSYVWWASTIIYIFWEKLFGLYYTAMFFAGLILFLQVIPGILIHKKWKRNYA